MIRIENDCVGPCPQGCIDCGKKRTPHYYCDECGEEVEPEELYEYDDGRQRCAPCLLGNYKTLGDV